MTNEVQLDGIGLTQMIRPVPPFDLSVAPADGQVLAWNTGAGKFRPTYAKRAEDPRAFGLTGGADDSPALQACINAAGAGGVVELPPLSINYGTTLVLPTGLEFRGSGMKASILQCTTDIACLSMVGGEGQAIKNLKIANSFTGTRNSYDIDIVNPFKPVLEHVEIALSQSSLAKGGVRLYKDVGQAGSANCFMPTLTDVWIRNGTLRIADVTDVKVHGGWVWGTYTGAPGAVELSAASNCSFTDFDIVPSVNAGYLISGGLSNLTIIGGLMDGSYDTVVTGWGIKCTDYVRGLSVTGVKFYNLSLGGVNITDMRRSAFVGNIFVQNNKGDNAYPDITLASAVGNVFAQNTFGAPNTRTSKGKIYVEDASSSDNLISQNVLEINSSISPNGHYYDPALFTVQSSTAITGNRPQGNWPTSTALAKSTAYTVLKDDLFNRRTIFVTGTTTITLPSVNSVHAGDDIVVKNTGTALVTVATTSSQTIDTATTLALAPQQSVRIVSNGSGSWSTITNPAAAPTQIMQLNSLVSAAVWPAVNRAVFARFALPTGGVYRYLKWRCDVQSGNVQVGVVALSGTDHTSYTRAMNSGVIACPAAGDIRTDLGATYLPAGDYAMFLWADNVTFQGRTASNSNLATLRSGAIASSLATGVGTSGTFAWDNQFVNLALEGDV
jgi:hypothetical protein